MSQVPEQPDLTDVESALRGLVPCPARLDRDRLMFDAGAATRGSASVRSRVWPALSGVLALVVAGESLALALRPAPSVVERIVFVPGPPPAVVRQGEPPGEPGLSVRAARQEPRPPDAATDSEQRLPPAALPGPEADPPFRWTTVAEAHRLQDFAFRSGVPGLPEPTRADRGPDRPADRTDTMAPSVGELRRRGLDPWFNLGDPS